MITMMVVNRRRQTMQITAAYRSASATETTKDIDDNRDGHVFGEPYLAALKRSQILETTTHVV